MRSGDWECIDCSTAYVQPVFKQKKVNGRRVRSKCPGHQRYEYLWERITSDKKAMKTIKSNYFIIKIHKWRKNRES